jgi:predicted RNA-binding protein with TRAM domain
MTYERRGSRSFGPRFQPKPVEIGKEYDVEIQETSRRGEGIARIKGLVCFVPNTKPGEHVKIRITRISRRFAEAEVVGKTEEKVVEEIAETPPKEEPAEAEVVGKTEEKVVEEIAETPPKEEPAEAETKTKTPRKKTKTKTKAKTPRKKTKTKTK